MFKPSQENNAPTTVISRGVSAATVGAITTTAGEANRPTKLSSPQTALPFNSVSHTFIGMGQTDITEGRWWMCGAGILIPDTDGDDLIAQVSVVVSIGTGGSNKHLLVPVVARAPTPTNNEAALHEWFPIPFQSAMRADPLSISACTQVILPGVADADAWYAGILVNAQGSNLDLSTAVGCFSIRSYEAQHQVFDPLR